MSRVRDIDPLSGGSREIAFITADGETISKHFGRAPYYLVVTIEDGQAVHREMRPKPSHSQFVEQDKGDYQHSEQHSFTPAFHSRHVDMAQAIADCQVLSCAGMGSGAYEAWKCSISGLLSPTSVILKRCTAGFPVLWTNLLVEQGASSSMVITLKASRLEEKQGRVLKLFGGVLMMALAAVMLIDPSLMNDLGTSAVIFVTAFSVAGVILIVHRTILPQLGIWVGSEAQEKHVHKHTQADQGEE